MIDNDLKQLLRTTSKYITLLENNGILSIKDFLNYFPRTYEDRSTIKPLDEMIFNEKGVGSTKGVILTKKVFRRGGKMIYDIQFQDEKGNKGYISIFNSGYLASKILINQRYIIVGKPAFKFGKIIFSHPDVLPTTAPEQEIDEGSGQENIYNSGRIFPIYSELNGIKPGRFAKKTWTLLDSIPKYYSEYLPTEFLSAFNLMNVQDTMRNIHYPETYELKDKAMYRIFFDRLLRIQLFSLMNRKSYQGEEKKLGVETKSPNREIVKEISTLLPFELTHAQKKVIIQIIQDFHSGKAMLRLLQGDVGSGKTVVATIAAYYIKKEFGGQSVFLAPLEVLATQHYKTIAKLLLPLGLRLELITGSTPKSQKEKIKQDLENGRIDVIIGTHALLQDDITFNNLQYVCIDEQHKFGVKQRATFRKFNAPHILQMSATPIPRSMALAFFGEFDVSIIDELPIGRKKIQTKIISEKERYQLKPRIVQKIEQGQKVFVVTPLIEESEKLDEVKSALSEFEEIQNLYPELQGKIGLLHGKLRPQEKEKIMDDFKKGSLCLLVSTTVIEVGVDIPEATIMIIKNAERFGLSQLHQLRGRIGRNELQSYCFLETPKKSGETYERIKSMEEISDGFKLAELDLKNRGAGEILGTMQSGETDIPLQILTDIKFIEKVQEGAKWLLEKHPDLEGLGTLKEQLKEKVGGMLV